MEHTETIETVIQAAYILVEKRRNEFITPEHFLLASIQQPAFSSMLGECADIKAIATDLIKAITEMDSLPEESLLTYEYSEQFTEMYRHALQAAYGSGVEKIGMSHCIYGIFQLEESVARYTLERYLKVSIPDFLNAISTMNEDVPEFDDRMERFFTSLPALTNLIGREKEIEEAIRVLCRKHKNNLLIIGESGVGKTAFASGLQYRILKDSNYRNLAGYELYELSVSKLLSGTQYRGDLENRIEEVMKSVEESKLTIVYIDDFKSLGTSGKMEDGSRDILKLLVPYMKEGRVKFVISATPEDLKYIQTNEPSVYSLFRRIELNELSDEESTLIIENASKDLAWYHGVRYDKKVIEYTIRLSRRYITDRCLPDKAIDVLDEAGAYAMSKGQKKVTCKTIEAVISDICKTDVQVNDDNTRKSLLDLEKNIKKSIYGQDEAVRTITEAILMSKAGLLDSGKTIGNFLFVGPTGVGKTELSKVLAQQLHLPLHRFDMSEYSEKHSVAKLIGSPAGYVGYEDGGILTSTVRKNPHCVLLLDEIEKAHEDIYNLLLQIMDYAIISDNKGRKVDFRNAIIIMTSNAGARYANKASVGYEKKVNAGAAMAKEVKKVFAPEFINRLSSVVVFNDMDRHMAGLVLKAKLNKLQERLDAQKVRLDISKETFEKLLDEGYSQEYGAREIERIVNKRITPALMREILFGKHKDGFTFSI